MNNQALHITNGDHLTNILLDLGLTDDIITWQEILCEGPTTYHVGSEEFLKMRSDFLKKFYDIDFNTKEFNKEISKLNQPESYTEIVLWFEYDLFCHINMLAVVNMIKQKGITLPIHLVCSGRVEGEKNLKALSELSSKQLMFHYKNKTLLQEKDIQECKDIWQIYCGKDHNLIKPFLVKTSSFQYLSNCLKAHLQRFPDSKSGLNILETNILEIIKKHTIKSRHHLLGYALNFQGYYGYGDLQFFRMFEKLSIFFSETEGRIKLNRKGYEALLGHHNFSSEINSKMIFGGVNKIDFKFSKRLNKLVESVQ
ncbi:hypothetical protein APS56_03555 [Pseudalgibacter alginicilyticus]|uniref:DUF1835 domain-containing protein n=1 Tax=Pseudalgibacter alginicilyticus TaxID=1736674 RepID=A0A0P0CV49_9FLAO|nr:hypothetical protein [Pseudalgibacter alginicilyticus]ALJ04271.1 hypothetical protein APS56_03555 [Pseudalgibacter alginicilyticus]